jgi:hypothetical protein
MADDPQTNIAEPTKGDIAASEACTRSGAFILLLFVALLLLIPYWIRRPADIALGRYVAVRNELAISLGELQDDPFWQRYLASHPAADTMSIAQLVNLQVDESSFSDVTTGKNPPGHPTVPARPPAHSGSINSGPPRPSPPAMLSLKVFGNVSEMRPIADLLSELNDSDLLAQARQFSNFFDLSIYTWAIKRDDLLVQRINTSACYKGKGNPMAPYKVPKPAFFVPAIKEDVLLKCFTLRDVRELAQFQLPEVSNPTQLGGSIGQTVEVTTGSLPHDLYMASVVVQILLFFTIMYFGAFAREAVSSPSFPVRGTLFSALSKSPWTLLVFLMALWAPLVASLTLAYCSGKWPLALCTLGIFMAIGLAHLVLQRNSLFKPLRLRLGGSK